jgi:hypothetical protein
MTDIRALIADDAFAASFQSLGQYRTALLAALAQPEPQGPSDEELRAFYDSEDNDEYEWPWWHRIFRVLLTRYARPAIEPVPQGPTDEEIEQEAYANADTDDEYIAFKRGAFFVQERISRPTIVPVPQQEDIHYAWELHDAKGEWQAGGSANSLDDVQREGNRYLQTYSQDGPHKLIIERHCVTTIEPVPGVEGADA